MRTQETFAEMARRHREADMLKAGTFEMKNGQAGADARAAADAVYADAGADARAVADAVYADAWIKIRDAFLAA